jgi:hypothetical protein
LRVDFTDVQAGFEAIPAGWYKVAITDGEERTSGENAKNPGAPYINWELTIQEGEFNGRKVWVNTSLLPQALFSLKGMMAATGKWSEEELNQSLEFDIPDLIGERCQCKVAVRKYNDEDRNDVKGFRPYDEEIKEAAGSGSMLP